MKYINTIAAALALVACASETLKLEKGSQIDWSERRRSMNIRVPGAGYPGDEVAPNAFAITVQRDCLSRTTASFDECTTILNNGGSSVYAGDTPPTDPWLGSTCAESACVAQVRL